MSPSKLQINLKLADKMLPPSVIRGIRAKLMQASARALWDEIAMPRLCSDVVRSGDRAMIEGRT